MSSDAQDVPLALSDIMHTLSPSPGPPPHVSFPVPNAEIQPTNSGGLTPAAYARNVAEHESTENVAGQLLSGPDNRESPKLGDGPDVSSNPDTFALGRRPDTSEEETDFISPSDLQSIRSRLAELGLANPEPSASSGSGTSRTPVERELGAMVLRLMNHHDYMLHQDLSGQLAAQAETIASLTSQRDLLIREAAEAHASWQVERDGWERSAEALIKQRTLVMAMHKEAIVDRLVARLEDENRTLRNTVAGLRGRLATVESELFRLRPLLLIPPLPPERTKPVRSNSIVPSSHNNDADRHLHRSREPTVGDVTEQSQQALGTSVVDTARESNNMVQDLSAADLDDNMETSREHTAPPASQDTVVEASVPNSSQLTLSSQATLRSQASFEPPPPYHKPQPSHSYYRTPRDREVDLAIPSPRRYQTAVSSSPSKHALSRSATLDASNSQASSSKQVMNPLWLPPSNVKKLDKKATAFFSDARAELILSAARKVGKERVGAVAGIVGTPLANATQSQDVEEDAHGAPKGKGKGKERAVPDWSRTPVAKGKARETESQHGQGDVTGTPTPKKQTRRKTTRKANTLSRAATMPTAGTSGTNYYASLPAMSHLVYLNPMHTRQGIPIQMAGGPVYLPVSGIWPPNAHPNTVTPSSSHDATQGGEPSPGTPSRTQSTPTTQRTAGQGPSLFNSLIDAARILEEDEASVSDRSSIATPTRTASTSKHPGRGTAQDGTVDSLDSTPLAKLRRVAPGTPSSALGAGEQSPTPKRTGSAAGLARVSSALDVLADQAAQEQERRPSVGPVTRRRSAGRLGQPSHPVKQEVSLGSQEQSGERSDVGTSKGAGGARMAAGSASSLSSASSSRKRRRSSSGSERRRTRSEASSPGPSGAFSTGTQPTNESGSQPAAFTTLLRVSSQSSVSDDAGRQHSAESPEPSPTHSATPSSDMDAPGSPESTKDVAA